MCEPISPTVLAVASVAVAAASAGAGLYAQSEASAAQAKFQEKQAQARNDEIAQNYQLASESARQSYAAIMERSRQEGVATSQEETSNAREAAKARATVRTSAGEAGVAGLSLNALVAEFTGQEAAYRNALGTNLGYTTAQLEYEAKGVQSQGQGRVNAVRPFMGEPIKKPNYLGAALQVGGDAISAYRAYKAPNTTKS